MQNTGNQDDSTAENGEVVQAQPKPRKPKKKAAKKPTKVIKPGSVVDELVPSYGRQVVTGFRFTVDLQSRHGEWLQRVAKLEGRSPENMLERLVRIAYSQDPYKGNPPETDGQSFSGRAADLKGS